MHVYLIGNSVYCKVGVAINPSMPRMLAFIDNLERNPRC
jgi:hypothetical protein